MNSDESWLLREKYLGEKTEGFFADCKRLKNGEPLAYIIGHIPFLSNTIHLDSHPLIPRTETEYWVEKVLSEIRSHRRGQTPTMRVLDLCAGSGCIGVAVLTALQNTHVDFAEMDVRHHPTIVKNLDVNGIDTERATTLAGDLFEKVTGEYDYILSNPPYIDKSLNRAQPSVTNHEPHNALFADDAGFSLIERIIAESPAYLKVDGVLVIEHEPEHVSRINDCAHEYGFICETRCDQYNVWRYTVLTRTKPENM